MKPHVHTAMHMPLKRKRCQELQALHNQPQLRECCVDTSQASPSRRLAAAYQSLANKSSQAK